MIKTNHIEKCWKCGREEKIVVELDNEKIKLYSIIEDVFIKKGWTRNFLGWWSCPFCNGKQIKV